jgi:C1A family cysteine protease
MALVQEQPGQTKLASRRIKRYGWRPDLPDHRDRIFNLEESIQKAHALPGKVDLSPQMPPIYDQGQLGSCTGNGVARVLEYESIRQGEPAATPSRLFIYYNERVIEGTVNTDSGAQIRDGIKVVATEGAPPETEWPYSDADPGRFQEKPPAKVYADATKHEALIYQRIVVGGPGAPMRTALASGYAIVFGFSVPAYFEPGGGNWDPTSQPLPLPGPNDQIIGGHCVVVTGYDFTCSRFARPAFQCDNSWGTSWGMNGRFWMDYDWFDPNRALASDLWVIKKVK